MTQQEIEQRIKELELELSILKSTQFAQTPQEEFSFSDLVDCEQLQILMNYFYELVGLGVGIIDTNKKIVVATGWQEACTKFHRVHLETCKKCLESDEYISKMQNAVEPIGYKCKNGMWDIAFPVIIDGKILAGVYFGQFFFDTEEIDYGFFGKQAEKYGFDKEEYIKAIKKVPIVSHQKVKTVITYYSKLAQLIADIGYQNLIIKREQIQERLISQQRLIESENLLNETGKIANVGGWKINLQTKELTWTKEVYRIHEVAQTYKPNVEDATNFYVDSSKEIIKKVIREAIQYGKSFDEDLELRTQKGNLLNIRVLGGIEKDCNGAEAFVAGIFQDITKQKQIEFRLQQANLSKDRFLAILAHDLKNPFHSIMGFSNLLLTNLREYDIDKIENFLTFIHQSTQQTYNLLEDLLLWSKSQAGRLMVQSKKIKFNDFCMKTIDALNIYACTKGIKITCSVSESLNLWADENMLKIILRNLISNAIKFTNIDGEIRIVGEKNDNYATITISDNGMGIEKDKLDRIWDFTTPYVGKNVFNEVGTGFGLVFCKELVEKHGGTIWVESEYNKGSDFKFTLPLYKEI